MKASERRVRVILTDGERTTDFAWLRHAGRQIVCGVPETTQWHSTYPEDGRFHITVKNGAGHRRGFVPPAVPLDGFTGHRALLTLAISGNLADVALKPFDDQPQDAVAFLDLRTFGDALVWTELGIVEASRPDHLQFDFTVRQILLVTNMNPWVYIASGVKDGMMTW